MIKYLFSLCIIFIAVGLGFRFAGTQEVAALPTLGISAVLALAVWYVWK